MIAAPQERVYGALTRVLESRGAEVLFERPETGVLAFEWSRGQKRGARSRTVVRLTPATGDETGMRVHTSGYIPTSQPVMIDLGLNVGPKFVGGTDARLEHELVSDVEKACKAPGQGQ